VTWVDFVRGSGTTLLIMAVAGAIAYVGDRVGHQVGRRRLTLFGIRPRYTSTIVAIGTGMLIALGVTLIALGASREVRNAFFRMNQITTRIAQLEAQQNDLEAKVNTGELVVPVNALMTPLYLPIKRGTPVDQRIAQIERFYRNVVDYVNQTWAARGLKRYVVPAGIDKKLTDEFGGPEVTEASLNSDLLMFATAQQNLYRNDDLHFQLQLIPDVELVKKGGAIASLIIPAGAHANPELAINELEQVVSSIARSRLNLPSFLSDNVRVEQLYPSLDEMSRQLAGGSGNYLLSAFAYQDIYPRTGGIPLVVTLTQAK
jgi:outer membrane murein-binding lipoprotein Lpp